MKNLFTQIQFWAIAFILIIIPYRTYSQDITELNVISEFDAQEQSGLYEIGGIATGEEGTLYLSDQLVYKVHAVNNQGISQQNVGARGKGPAEFSSSPANIAVDNKHHKVGVLDLTTSKINVFDSKLNSLHHVLSEYPPSDIVYDKNGNLIVGIPPVGMHYDSVIGYNQGQEFSFNLDLKLKNLIFDIFYIEYLSESDHIVTVYQYRNLIQVYEKDGTLVSEFRIPELPEESAAKEKNMGGIREVPEDNMFNDVATYDNTIYVLGAAYSEHKSQDVYVLSENGGLINTLMLESPAGMLAVDENYLYSKEGNKIKKYRLGETNE